MDWAGLVPLLLLLLLVPGCLHLEAFKEAWGVVPESVKTSSLAGNPWEPDDFKVLVQPRNLGPL